LRGFEKEKKAQREKDKWTLVLWIFSVQCGERKTHPLLAK
jgi:hypothetical protein